VGQLKLRSTRNNVEKSIDGDSIESERRFIKSLVSDSVARVNFLNAMLAAFITVLALAYSIPQVALTIAFVLVCLWVPLFFYIIKLKPAGLVEQSEVTFHFWERDHTLPIRPYLALRIVLIAVNFGLLIITDVNQYHALHAVDSPRSSSSATVSSAAAAPEKR
jgi:hypothetical protein